MARCKLSACRAATSGRHVVSTCSMSPFSCVETAESLYVIGPSPRDHDVAERQPTFQQIPNLLVRPRRRDAGPFGAGAQEQGFVQADALVAQQFRGVRGKKHLPAGSTLRASEHLGHHADDARMKRKFGFFQQQRPLPPLHRRPEKSDEPQRPVRKSILRLPGSRGTPMPIFATQAGRTVVVVPQFDLFELWNRDAKGCSGSR